MRPIYQIIIHCSDSTWGDAEVIDSWHEERGFHRIGTPRLRSIGYHAVILNDHPKGSRDYKPFSDGKLERGRDVHEVGAHVRGHNSNSLGICLIGKGDHYTSNQIKTLKELINVWKSLYGDNHAFRILGHNDLDSNKTCPGFDVETWLKENNI